MKTWDYITIFKIRKVWYNIFSIELLIPSIEIGRCVPDESLIDELVDIFNIKFDTNIKFIKKDYYWNFNIKILGFGICIYRQWSY
jgi:hypothetical protein